MIISILQDKIIPTTYLKGEARKFVVVPHFRRKMGAPDPLATVFVKDDFRLKFFLFQAFKQDR